jgi:hypothetical protein
MNNFNLLLTYTLDHDAHVHVRGASRIQVDGRGGLLIYDPETGMAERLSIAEMNSIRIGSPSQAAVPSYVR